MAQADNKPQANEHEVLHLAQLLEKTVKKVIFDGEEVYGLEFHDGTKAWIMRDPEGNGPGHLDIMQN